MQKLENWIEYDYNPSILFDANAKIISLNKEAQYLLGVVSAKEIFQIAKSYANITYGYKTTMLDVQFGVYRFYGFTVGYEDEDEIYIKLYKEAPQKFKKIDGEKVNLYELLDLCMSVTLTQKDIKFTKEFDPTLPNVMLPVKEFTKLLTKSYQQLIKSDKITTKLSLRTGEYIKFESKKYPIFNIHLISNVNNVQKNEDIKSLGLSLGCNVVFEKNSILITSPLIME